MSDEPTAAPPVETNYIHLPQHPLNGTQLECDGSELRPDGTCAKCERINERIEAYVSQRLNAPTPGDAAKEEHSLADVCGILDNHPLRGEYEAELSKPENEGLPPSAEDEEPNEKLKALFKVEENKVETAPAGVEALKRVRDLPESVAQYQTAIRIIDMLDGWREKDTWISEWDSKEEMTEAVAAIIRHHSATPLLCNDILQFFGATLKDDGGISINMKKYHTAHLCKEHEFQPWKQKDIEERCALCLQQRVVISRAKAIAECVDVVKATGIDHSAVNRAFTFKAEAIAALESLAKGEGEDG